MESPMRKITSLTLILSGIVEVTTSIVLYIMPAGRVAYWTDYRLLGLSKTQWGDIHITVGTLMLVMAGLHLYYNWRPLLSYVRNRAKKLSFSNKQVVSALLLTAYVTTGTLCNWPPMNGVIALGEYFTAEANTKYGEPPYGHAELSSLRMFAKKMDLELNTAMELLKEAGIRVENARQPILQIAQNNTLTPQQLYEIIKPAAPTDNGVTQLPEAPFPGFGKQTFTEICTRYNLPQDRLLKSLRDTGLRIVPDDSIKAATQNNGTTPMAIFELIRDNSGQRSSSPQITPGEMEVETSGK